MDSRPRQDALAKVAGREKYASDLYPPGFLWLGVKRADHPHARIVSIDTSQAEALEGVRAVLTHRHVRGKNRVGVPEFDQPVLCDEKVRHRGDPVALVLAESLATVAAAVDRVRVSYEVLPAVFDPEEALKPGAPLIHENAGHGNLLLGGAVSTGEGAAALAGCDFVAEGTFHLPCQEHAYLETECGVAWAGEDGVLTIVASTQTPHRDRLELANGLGVAPEKVRVIAPYLGGGFGGKDGISVQGVLGLAALHAGGRPVKIWNSREESFLSSTKRHRASVEYSVGCKKDGTLHALRCRVVLDTGAYACLGGAVLTLAIEHAGGIYRFPHASIEGRCVYTNNPMAGAFRGFGVPQVNAALEQLIDDLAGKCGFDGLEFRLKNALRPGDRSACGARMGDSNGIVECLESVRAHRLWKEREDWIALAPKRKRRGVGLAAALHGMGYGPVVPDTATAKIEVQPDGKFDLFAGVSDMGQGNIATFLQIAAAILNQPVESIRPILPDTCRTAPCGSSSASRTTFTYGNALIGACRRLERAILTQASEILSIAPDGLRLESARVVDAASGRVAPLSEIVEHMDTASRIGSESYTAEQAAEVVGDSRELRSWGLPHTVFSYAAQLAYIEIDELTGEASVRQYLSCTDAGNVLNPGTYEQQVHGGIAQGLGYALFEDFQVENGVVKTPNLTTYILPTSLDVADVTTIAVTAEEPKGPFGMKGLGEIVIDPVYPAVANAVREAVGAGIMEGPFTPERILRALAGEL